MERRRASPLSFSPDGSEVLVASDLPGSNQLFVVPGLRQLTQDDEAVTGQFLPDGRVLVERTSGGNERTQLYVGDEPLVVDERYKHDTPHSAGRTLAYVTNRRNEVDFDVVARDLESGEERTFEFEGYVGVAAISPDGRRIVADRAGARSGDNDLFLCDVDSGDVTHLTPHDERAEYVTPVFRGDELVWATNEGRDTFAVGGIDSPWDVTCYGDAEHLLLHTNEDGYSRLTLDGVDIPLPGRGLVSSPVFSRVGSKLAYAFSTPTQPSDVYVYDGETTRVTTSAEPIDGLVEPSLHRLESFDGESIPVFLFEPPGDGPFPVVVTVHGGPEAQYQPEWHVNYAPLTQYLVSRGYAVAAPNVRGSTGYGKRFEHLDDIRLRMDSVRDLASLHAWLTARPEIDGSRQVIYGRSYGGFMVLAALAFQPELWAAGVESVGISSWVTFLENTSPYRRKAREREYGSLENDREFLEEISPITHVDAIRAPLYVQHGANDPRVPLSESEQIARVLSEKGIRCELVVYPDEGHSIAKMSNRVDSFTRMVAFLDEVL
ncbi:MAG TPA: S9 family peptidase [Gaiellaceae bacterium]|nr:S9 family peptidase [Gaiellaceae bacterium]